jgi:hypothetical protein
MTTTTIDSNRRFADDRRCTRPPLLSSHRWNGRRKAHRRTCDATTNRLDHYDPRLLAPSLTILVLCVVDALITLRLLERGAVEINLIMRFLIEEGMVAFIATKYLMTASSVVWLVAHNNFKIFQRVRVEHLIYACAGVYVSLLVYELALLKALFSPAGPA